MAATSGILGAVIEVAKCIPVKHQFNYLCCFNNNIQSLQDEARKLQDAIKRLQMRVDAAGNNAEVIYPEVQTWLENASQLKSISGGIINDVPNVQKGCLNLISRYSLSKKAKTTAEDIWELLNNCKFDTISQDPPPAASESRPLGPKEVIETRKKIEEDVMKALRDRNVNIVGLSGMGGVGKTTMAKRIMDRVKEEELFVETVMVAVGQEVQMFELQQSIAAQLSLTLDVNDWRTREYKIRTRLTGDKRTILIVVDDVWDVLQLQDLGIPKGNTCAGRCTVLLTSRDRNALDQMGARIFGMEILQEREAWLVFKEKTGNCVDREDLRSVAKDVAKECNGLPLAIVAVGGALKNKKSRELWEDARDQLRSFIPVDLRGMSSHVYKSLKLSYDYLEDERAKCLFLLCSMFEDDVDIYLEILTWYGMGLSMFEELQNLNKARNKTYALIQGLKDRSLLLAGSNDHHVKMHDIVRDMALRIASEEHRGGFVINADAVLSDHATQEEYFKNCYWILITKLSNRSQFPVELKCPSLRVLMMRSEGVEFDHDDHKLKLADKFFDGMQEMRVLSIEGIRIRSLPPTQMLKNLKTLRLFRCPILESINVVGELLKLELLSCCGCYNIKALPTRIGRLNRLRLLEIIHCRSLKTIVPGVISSLVSLEELRLQYSFRGWEAKESIKKENAALAELESLTKLTSLKIEMNDVSLVAEEICLPPEIVKYDIKIAQEFSGEISFLAEDFSQSMFLEIPAQMNVGNWIKTLLRSTEFLYLKGDGANQVNFAELEKMKFLILKSCSSVKKLVNPTNLLEDLDNLEEVIPVGCSFRNLKRIRVRNCPRLLGLFPVSVAITNLTQLKVLEVEDCEAVQDIFCDDHDISSHNLHMAFPKLETLFLRRLPKLIAQRSLDKIVAPGDLRELSLCNLKDDGSRVWSLFSSFSNLETIEIIGFDGTKNLMSPSIAENLVHLRNLMVINCKMMVEVIADDEEEVQVRDQKISLFPSLVALFLEGLPKLRSFCQWNHHNTTLELPSLKYVDIYNCRQMETFTQGSISTPMLVDLKLGKTKIEIKDLNEAI